MESSREKGNDGGSHTNRFCEKTVASGDEMTSLTSFSN